MRRAIQCCVFLVALGLFGSDLRSADPTENPWEIRMYLEDHEITSPDALGVAVRVTNYSNEKRSISNAIGFRRTVVPATQRSGHDAPPDQFEHKEAKNPSPDEGRANAVAGDTHIVVIIEGPFVSVDEAWLTVRSRVLTTITLTQNQNVTQTDSTPTNVFAPGEYSVRAALYDGSREVASSKTHHLQVKDARAGNPKPGRQ